MDDFMQARVFVVQRMRADYSGPDATKTREKRHDGRCGKSSPGRVHLRPSSKVEGA
jgi:hypothetical protein